VRHRGQWARSWPKKPLKIFFNQDKLFEGHGSLNLNSGWRDPAFVREMRDTCAQLTREAQTLLDQVTAHVDRRLGEQIEAKA
jgi:hypothetical protein